MPSDRQPSITARSVIGLGHLLLGGAALVFGGVLVATALSPSAELEGALIAPGLLLVLAGAVFTGVAATVLRDSRRDVGGYRSGALGVVEIVVGVGLAAATAVAVRGYGAFEPWRSPLLLPTVLVLTLGTAAVSRAASR